MTFKGFSAGEQLKADGKWFSLLGLLPRWARGWPDHEAGRGAAALGLLREEGTPCPPQISQRATAELNSEPLPVARVCTVQIRRKSSGTLEGGHRAGGKLSKEEAATGRAEGTATLDNALQNPGGYHKA